MADETTGDGECVVCGEEESYRRHECDDAILCRDCWHEEAFAVGRGETPERLKPQRDTRTLSLFGEGK